MNPLLLQRDAAFFTQHHAETTVREILQQPRLWKELTEILSANRTQIAQFMERMNAIQNLRIVFTGAGSSAFIGSSMQLLLARELGLVSEAVATTDIVSAPDAVLYDVPTLLVSFSRSGESPESMAALEYARTKLTQVYNLVLVCKEGSSLANLAASMGDTMVLCMPPESSDKGFAMTSSVSCMALAAWCVFNHQTMDARLAYVQALAAQAQEQLEPLDAKAQEIAAFGYDRIVYLGSGGLRGLAQEGAVKSLELTNGLVNSAFDSSMGFRHGPKTAVNDTTLTVHMLSPLPLTCQYDADFLQEITRQRGKNRQVALYTGNVEAANDASYPVPYTLPQGGNPELGAYIMNLLFLQLLSMEKSIACGIPTDSPSVGGQVNRVVQGVIIYDI